MNTTLTRMVYDRLTRQQQLSIAVALATTHIATDREIAGEETSQSYQHTYHQVNQSLDIEHCCLVYTECRAQRCATFS